MAASVELAPEDALRLHVLLAGEVLAVRIDEGQRLLWALTPKGEARIPLHPIGRSDAYFMRVREVLGGHALGSPGGYPVHLRRWTRMGQSSSKNLEALLKLGEPEAVAAVAHAPGLTDELARRAWWAWPSAEIARSMLGCQTVRTGETGPVLASFLVEHLPFEEDPVAAMNTVRSVLAAGLLDEPTRLGLWQKARRKPAYYLGFLESQADDLPPEAPLPLPADLPDNAWSRMLARCFSGTGQAYLKAAEQALDKPPAHETVYLLLNLLGRHFSSVRGEPGRDALPERHAEALSVLAQLRAEDAEPILTRTTAVGPLMRRKLEPLLDPLVAQVRSLRVAP
ncbi:MAG: hypothetical protein PHU46_00605 [Rhodocyclaceae bacterium]|nr:hypothetical protein [Rhodocyclaceae bacterium]